MAKHLLFTCWKSPGGRLALGMSKRGESSQGAPWTPLMIDDQTIRLVNVYVNRMGKGQTRVPRMTARVCLAIIISSSVGTT